MASTRIVFEGHAVYSDIPAALTQSVDAHSSFIVVKIDIFKTNLSRSIQI